MFDAQSFFEEYNIEYYISGDIRHPHIRDGWINTECPRCSGNPGYHLGFSENSGMFVCWRCGFFPTLEVIKTFLRCDWRQAKRIAKKFGGDKEYKTHIYQPKEKDIDVVFPDYTQDKLTKKYRRYLESRNFDPDRIQDLWDIKCTGKWSDLRNRLVIPITYNGRLMSYTTRSILEDVKSRYITCTIDKERRHHKHCLYGFDQTIGDSVLVLEGPTDVWRMGPGSVATFGIKYTESQVLLLFHNFKNIHVMFDETEQEAQNKAQELTKTLSVMGRHAEHIKLHINHDPANLSDKDANYVMRELMVR